MLWPETEPIKLPRSVAPKYTDVSQVIEGPLQTCNIWGANIYDLDICGRIKSNLLKTISSLIYIQNKTDSKMYFTFQ